MSLLEHEFEEDYELMLRAWGEGVLSEAQLLDFQRLDAIFAAFKKKYRRLPREISLELQDSRAAGCDYGFTGIDPALLEKLPALKELILPPSVTALELTPAARAILKSSRTLIRGAFDSYAERFAVKEALPFRPADLLFAEYEFHDTTTLFLIFTRDGKAVIRESCSEPGSSCSHTYGGDFYHPLPDGFYLRMTAEDVAAQFGGGLHDAIISDGRLAAFIEKAKTHGFFTGNNA